MGKPSEGMRLVRFGTFEANFTTGELRKQGIRLKIQDQPFQILKMLLACPGELVTRDEIRQKLWPSGTFVDFDNGLNAAVNRLREALSDSADHPKFIETLPRRGYRFIGTLDGSASKDIPVGQSPASLFPRERDGGSSPQPSGLRSRTLASHPLKKVLLASTVLAFLLAAFILLKPEWRSHLHKPETSSQIQVRSLAVLPLENRSGDPAQEYFADGMTDELTTTLAKINGLRVISRTSAAQYKAVHKPLRQIAKELGVDAVVEGAVLRSGNRVRITAQLIHASTDAHLWADTYDRDVRDVLALQDDVSRAISQQIQLNLTPADRALNAGPANPEAFDDYLRGRFYWNKWTEDGIRNGISYFENAIRIDPQYALAYAGLADSYNSLGDFGIGVLPPREASAQAEADARQAIKLNDHLAEAHAALAMALWSYDRNWRDAENEFKKAIELNSGYATAHHWYAHYLMAAGRLQESLSESQRAFQLSPVDPEMGVHLQWHYFYTRNYDAAIQQGINTLQLDPNFHEAHLYLGLAYEQEGRYDQAAAELENALDLSRGRSITVSALGHFYALSGGKKAEALKMLRELQDSSKRQYVPAYDVAILNLGLGDKDHALAALQRAYEEGSFWMFTIGIDPRLDSLRSDRRFQALLRLVSPPQ